MKNLGAIIAVCVLTISVIGAANAGSYQFMPYPADLYDLDHTQYYSWGIDWNIPAGEQIVDAVLSINNIDNWVNENNALYIHLLDNPLKGVNGYYDNQGGGDYWAGKGPLIATYVDYQSGVAENLSYSLKDLGLLDTLNVYLATAPATGKANFGIGFDPDCHYNNCGVKLCVETAPVPEPSSILVLFGGLSSTLGFIRFRKK